MISAVIVFKSRQKNSVNKNTNLVTLHEIKTRLITRISASQNRFTSWREELRQMEISWKRAFIQQEKQGERCGEGSERRAIRPEKQSGEWKAFGAPWKVKLRSAVTRFATLRKEGHGQDFGLFSSCRPHSWQPLWCCKVKFYKIFVCTNWFLFEFCLTLCFDEFFWIWHWQGKLEKFVIVWLN